MDQDWNSGNKHSDVQPNQNNAHLSFTNVIVVLFMIGCVLKHLERRSSIAFATEVQG